MAINFLDTIRNVIPVPLLEGKDVADIIKVDPDLNLPKSFFTNAVVFSTATKILTFHDANGDPDSTFDLTEGITKAEAAQDRADSAHSLASGATGEASAALALAGTADALAASNKLRIDAQGVRIDSISVRTTEAAASAAAAQTTATGAETVANTALDESTSNKNQITQNAESIVAIIDDIERVDGNITNLTNSVSDTISGMNELGDAVEANELKIGENEAAISEVEINVGANTTAIADLELETILRTGEDIDVASVVSTGSISSSGDFFIEDLYIPPEDTTSFTEVPNSYRFKMKDSGTILSFDKDVFDMRSKRVTGLQIPTGETDAIRKKEFDELLATVDINSDGIGQLITETQSLSSDISSLQNNSATKTELNSVSGDVSSLSTTVSDLDAVTVKKGVDVDIDTNQFSVKNRPVKNIVDAVDNNDAVSKQQLDATANELNTKIDNIDVGDLSDYAKLNESVAFGDVESSKIKHSSRIDLESGGQNIITVYNNHANVVMRDSVGNNDIINNSYLQAQLAALDVNVDWNFKQHVDVSGARTFYAHNNETHLSITQSGSGNVILDTMRADTDQTDDRVLFKNATDSSVIIQLGFEGAMPTTTIPANHTLAGYCSRDAGWVTSIYPHELPNSASIEYTIGIDDFNWTTNSDSRENTKNLISALPKNVLFVGYHSPDNSNNKFHIVSRGNSSEKEPVKSTYFVVKQGNGHAIGVSTTENATRVYSRVLDGSTGVWNTSDTSKSFALEEDIPLDLIPENQLFITGDNGILESYIEDDQVKLRPIAGYDVPEIDREVQELKSYNANNAPIIEYFKNQNQVTVNYTHDHPNVKVQILDTAQPLQDTGLTLIDNGSGLYSGTYNSVGALSIGAANYWVTNYVYHNAYKHESANYYVVYDQSITCWVILDTQVLHTTANTDVGNTKINLNTSGSLPESTGSHTINLSVSDVNSLEFIDALAETRIDETNKQVVVKFGAVYPSGKIIIS